VLDDEPVITQVIVLPHTCSHSVTNAFIISYMHAF
jgi:hypothetical protein